MQVIIDIIKSAISKSTILVSKLGVQPRSIADIIAVYHAITILVMVGCGLAFIISPSKIVGILAILGVDLLIAYVVVLIHQKCPLTNIENIHRKKAGEAPIKYTPRYVLNLMVDLLRRLLGM